MFARNLHLHLKPNSVAEFTRTIEKEVIPLLRKQKGFQDEITFVTPNGTEVVGISLWDEKEDAEAYERRAYPAVLKALEKVAEGTPGFKPTRYPIRPSTRSLPRSQFCRQVLSPYLWSATKNPADASDHGLVLIDPPAVDERQQVATWMNQVRGSDTNFASAAD